MKNVIKLDVYHSPQELEDALKSFVHYYNYLRYHEAIGNVTPAQKYYGKAQQVIERRKKIKTETLKNRRKIYFKKTENNSYINAFKSNY